MNRSNYLWVALAAIALTCCAPWERSGLAQVDSKLGLSNTGPFVTVGKLIRSGATTNGTPKFSLLDEEGNVTAHVAPATGVNLARYVNRRVGVTARTVRRANDAIPYVLAQQVAPMDTDLEAVRETVGSGSRATSRSAVAGQAPRPLSNIVADPLIDVPVMEDPWADEAFADLLADEGQTVAAASAEEVISGPMYSAEVMPDPYSSGVVLGPGYGSSSGYGGHNGYGVGCDTGGCDSCGGYGPCGPPGRYWIRVEYLGWEAKDMWIPALVTTSPTGTAPQDAGVLGLSTTDILLGEQDILDEARNGGRIRMGYWFDYYQTRGIEFEYYGLDKASDSFSVSSSGSPILARPFFNELINEQDSELVAYPDIVSGAIDVDVDSEFHAGAIRFRRNLFCCDDMPNAADSCSYCDGCGDTMCMPISGRRVDFLWGGRYMNLKEGLMINENLTTVGSNNVISTFGLMDSFETENEFAGAELGLSWEGYRGPWTLDFTGAFALGNNRRRVEISGVTNSSTQGVNFTENGGLLALESNIGTYRDDEFVVIPQFTTNLGYTLGPHVRLVLGYSILYWNNVMRPGEAIDTNLNPNLIPPVIDDGGPAAPAFAFKDRKSVV